MSTSDDDFPEIGMRKQGMVLVCHGDDRPTQFADWLQPIIENFERLSVIANEFGIDMDLKDGGRSIVDVMDFCQRLDIEFSSRMWEGMLISGIYHLGWLKTGTVRATKAYAKQILQLLEKQIDAAVRLKVINEIQGIEDLEEFIERTSDDREELKKRIISLSSNLQEAKSALVEASEKVAKAEGFNTAEIDQACVRMASALLLGEKKRIVAGPLVLWDDGVVYAICDWGGSPIPQESSPAILLGEIRRAGLPLVLIRDKTVIGGWLSGPKFRKGPEHINGWLSVWAVREKRQRAFTVDPPEFNDRVLLIHEHLASRGDA